MTSGHPLKELADVRQLFFARPRHSLGGQDKEVLTQESAFDPNHSEDAQFVENVMWEDAKIMFVTVNLPGGSNNDLSPWTHRSIQLPISRRRRWSNNSVPPPTSVGCKLLSTLRGPTMTRHSSS